MCLIILFVRLVVFFLVLKAELLERDVFWIVLIHLVIKSTLLMIVYQQSYQSRVIVLVWLTLVCCYVNTFRDYNREKDALQPYLRDFCEKKKKKCVSSAWISMTEPF